MTELEAIQARHSVRQYLNKPLEPDELAQLRAEVDRCNQDSGLHIQLVVNETRAFEGSMARYGKFSGVQNYFALVGKAGPNLQEKCGYWGERLVLKAQQMGLNTCWVALTFTKVKSAYTLDDGEKLAAVIALGHGATQGVPHKSKPMEEVARVEGPLPFDVPMKLMFCSGAGAWDTLLTLQPDGSFEGDYHDADMTIEYVCQFHGRFGDIRQVTDASWSLTLEELTLDTKYPVGAEWDEGVIHYISSTPYGFDKKGGEGTLEPGAQFMFYTPEAEGYRPTDELYGMEQSDDYESVMYQFWSWWPDKHVWGPYAGPLGCYGLCNMATGQGFFDLKAWGIA